MSLLGRLLPGATCVPPDPLPLPPFTPWGTLREVPLDAPVPDEPPSALDPCWTPCNSWACMRPPNSSSLPDPDVPPLGCGPPRAPLSLLPLLRLAGPALSAGGVLVVPAAAAPSHASSMQDPTGLPWMQRCCAGSGVRVWLSLLQGDPLAATC
jgi:hypothetical protein